MHCSSVCHTAKCKPTLDSFLEMRLDREAVDTLLAWDMTLWVSDTSSVSVVERLRLPSSLALAMEADPSSLARCELARLVRPNEGTFQHPTFFICVKAAWGAGLEVLAVLCFVDTNTEC